MESHEVRAQVTSMMEARERIAWQGRSSSTAYLPSQIPTLAIMLFIGYVTTQGGTILTQAIRGDFSEINVISGVFLLIVAWMTWRTVHSAWQDMEVSWVITNRRVYRMSHGKAVVSDLRHLVDIETRPRENRRGSIIVTLPKTRDGSGDVHTPTVTMLDLDDMRGAYAAIAAAQEAPITILDLEKPDDI